MSSISITGLKTRLQLFLAVLIGRLICKLCQLLPHIGGTALPGLIGLKICPTLINQIREINQLHSIIITGTNGKTTTSRLLGHILKTQPIAIIQNQTGSNLIRGIASSLINQVSLNGKLSAHLAIWEVDEAVLPIAVNQLRPKHILFTNLFRDQLDRYGEIDTILAAWQSALKKISPSTQVFFNLDDPCLNFLSQSLKSSQTTTYGLPAQKMSPRQPTHSADTVFCPVCHQPLNFTCTFTSHLGHYSCSSCSFNRLSPDYSFSSISSLTKHFPLTDQYQLYSLLAAFSLARSLNVPKSVISQAVQTFKPVFGRGELFTLNSKPAQIHLTKNPAGFNVVLESLCRQKQLNSQPLLIAINDLTADGKDISWLWDVHLHLLAKRKKPVIASGLRAHDLALRLKYAGLDQTKILIQPRLKTAIKQLQAQSPAPLHLLASYTAMLSIRRILSRQKIVSSTWKL